ncbi:MAG: hypothetical protein WA477_15930 [Candidatus Sulfotelmatobacter sp.]
MNRREKLGRLLDIVPLVWPEFDVPGNPPRFAALERDENGNAVYVHLADSLGELKDAIATSETHFVEDVRVHDLDADTVFVPVWKVEQFVELEDEFSYEEGYLSIT